MCSLQLSAQQARVTGVVTDASNGDPLPGVTIQVLGTMTGTISQANGTYDVTIPAGSNTLVFSFVGYQTQEVNIGGRTVIDIAMVEEITALEEIVVTGYSVERKKDIIGSVSVVNTEDMQSMASVNALNQMQGRVSGVTITSDGSMDGGSKMRVRGFGSFAGSDPLYIIDGVPGDIDRLNPNDIQSVQILKDAASSSIYGARAANGVVIITTRQGQVGSNRVSVDYYYGINWGDKRLAPEMCSVEELGELLWLQMEGAGREVGDANWYHPIYGSGPTPVIPEYIMVNDHGAKYNGAYLTNLKNTDP
ncbi:MAG: TonB-dependent receptor plug domain-containing protein, partial [Bacteroidales bacterium]|nr:TonB-dependent receptor plug domain-containing protein [Bacteroidales bacterium]